MLTEIPKHNKGDAQKRDHYDSISTETRRMLVKLTQEDGVSIRKASKALQIKYSTGKTLIQLYKKTGRIDRVKQQRAKTIEAKHQVRKIIQKVLQSNTLNGEGQSIDHVSLKSQCNEEALAKSTSGRNNMSDNDMEFTPDEQDFLAIKQVNSLPNDQKIQINNGPQNEISRSSTYEAACNILQVPNKNDSHICEVNKERRNSHANCTRKPENFSRLAFQSKQQLSDQINKQSIFNGNIEQLKESPKNKSNSNVGRTVPVQVWDEDHDNEATKEQLNLGRASDCGINSNQETTNQNVTNQIVFKLLSHQNHTKSLDKETLLRCIKQLILNQRHQGKYQQPAGIPYGSLNTPEQVASHDLNQSKKMLESNQDQKKSINVMSTQVDEGNCEMTDASKKDQVSPFQGNEKECQPQALSTGKEKEQLTPRKPKMDINGYSNQQVLNYLLQKIDHKDKELEQPSEEQELNVKNRPSAGAAPIPASKQGSLSPEETDETVKKGSKMCQSEPMRVEDGPMPHQFQPAWDKNHNSDKVNFEKHQDECNQKAEICSQMKLSTDITRKEGHEQLSMTPKHEEEELEKPSSRANKVTINDYKSERLYQLKQYIKAQLDIPDHYKGETLQHALQKIDSSHLKQLVQQFNQLYPQKQVFSSNSNIDEKENCQTQKVQQPLKDSNGGEPKQKVQMKILNDLLHKLAANKNGNTPSSFNGKSSYPMVKNQFNLKAKSFISPKKCKYSLLGKRSVFNQGQKENQQGAAQPIYQPIPKRTKLDSPSFQPMGSELSEKSSGNRGKEQMPESLRNLVKQMAADMAANKDSGKQGSQQTFLQMLKNGQLQQNQLGEKNSKLKLQAQSKSSPQASNLYQLLLQEKQNTQSTHQAPLFGLKQKLMQIVENNRHQNNCLNYNNSSGAATKSSQNNQQGCNSQSAQQFNIFQLVSNRQIGSNSIISAGASATAVQADSKKNGNK